MIIVHRLNSQPMVLNADLIESVGSTPDTAITLIDGRRILVKDPVSDIVDRVREYRASILAAADAFRSNPGSVIELAAHCDNGEGA